MFLNSMYIYNNILGIYLQYILNQYLFKTNTTTFDKFLDVTIENTYNGNF